MTRSVGIVLMIILGAGAFCSASNEPSCDQRRQEVNDVLAEARAYIEVGDFAGAIIKQTNAEDLMRKAPVCFGGWRG